MVTAEAPLIETTRARRARPASTTRAIDGPAQQRPQLPRLHQAHARRHHRAGTGRRRAVDQRPEGHRQQHLGGRRRLQQPVLRRAARRPAAGLHLQPRRGARRWWWSPTAPTPSSAAPPGGFVNVVTKSGTNEVHGTGARLLQERRLSARRRSAPTAARRRSSTSTQHAGRLHPRRPARRRTRSSTSSPLDYQKAARRPSRPIPAASSRGSWTPSRPSAARTRTARSSAPTTPACSWPRSTGRPRAQQPGDAAATTTPGPSRRTAPSTSTRGAAAPTPSSRTTPTRVTGSLISHALAQPAQRVPLPVRARGPAAPLRRPEHHRPEPAAARTPRFDFGQQLPLRHAVLHPGRVLRHAHPVQRQRLAPARPPLLQGRGRVQPGELRRRPSSASPTAATSSARPTASSTTCATRTTSSARTARPRRHGTCPPAPTSPAPSCSTCSRRASAASRWRRPARRRSRQTRAGGLRPGHLAGRRRT